MQLTGITHSKPYGDGQSACAGYLETKGMVFVHSHGPFGNMPYHFSIEEARALANVLTAIVAENDEIESRLTAEYGPRV